ncbi:MAG: pyridoxamine 5'-phosphate oxidase [Elusimicrobia bacterium RIFOXYA2_FULL_40_6]|nr:MAG: pyridoxamine 5'-phosphate oxidase [Elusimicrobia bacterium RIFOXYA2_FULL_40_6]
MRRHDREITDKSVMEAIIKEAQVCRIALCDGDMPYIVPVCFGYKDDCLYIHSVAQGKKLDIIKKNNNVCFEIEGKCEIVTAEKACDYSMKYSSVIGTGKAVLIDDSGEKMKALDIVMGQYSQGSFQYPTEMMKRISVIKITIEQMTGKKSGE